MAKGEEHRYFDKEFKLEVRSSFRSASLQARLFCGSEDPDYVLNVKCESKSSKVNGRPLSQTLLTY